MSLIDSSRQKFGPSPPGVASNTSSMASSTQIFRPIMVLARFDGVVQGSSVSISSSFALGYGLATTGVIVELKPSSASPVELLLPPCCIAGPVGFSNSMGADFMVVAAHGRPPRSAGNPSFVRVLSPRHQSRTIVFRVAASLCLFLRCILGVDALVDRRGASHLEVQGEFCSAHRNRTLWPGIERKGRQHACQHLSFSIWLFRLPPDGSEPAHSLLIATQVLVRVLNCHARNSFPEHEPKRCLPKRQARLFGCCFATLRVASYHLVPHGTCSGANKSVAPSS